ncbi:MAG TPA: virulence factor [Stellaceae bacterium]|nr:virulence factor [Stellaceae bacterium]
MAQRIIVYWRDIPAQLIVRQGRTAERRELPERFIQAIDRTAMRVGARDSDAYMAEWRRGDPEPCGDDLAAAADAEAARLVETYDQERLDRLARQAGWETPKAE